MNIKFTMVGTDSGQYVGVATHFAQVGFCELPGNKFSVVVEPVDGQGEALEPLFPGWNAGIFEGKWCFSIVVKGETELCAALTQAFDAVMPEGEIIDVSAGCPSWVKDLALLAKVAPTPPDKLSEWYERQQLVARVRALKLPGWTFASRWNMDTLRQRLIEAQK